MNCCMFSDNKFYSDVQLNLCSSMTMEQTQPSLAPPLGSLGFYKDLSNSGIQK